ncbi:MAG: CPBP family intramembrane glutamic endopeptidase [Thermoanaerobaculia bacterium]
MTSVNFVLLVVAGSLGILLCFVQARSRAVFAEDGFAEPGRRALAMGLLGAVLVLVVAIPFAGALVGADADARELSLVSVFAVHATLVLFLICYYALSGRRSILNFLSLRSDRPAHDLAVGAGIGLVGWVLTILTAAVILGISYVLSPKERGGPAEASVSPMIVWLVAQPVWVKALIVLSAMVVEELFFRGFLQPRVGPVAATLMFTAAHGAYGQPLVLVGILVIAAVLAVTFALYRNVLPCVMAHGVFDAIQMFVIIPLALRSIPGF